MEETGRNFIKWTLAIILLAGVVAYSLLEVGNAFRAGIAFGDDGEETSDEESDEGGDRPPVPDLTGPVAAGQATPAGDVWVSWNVLHGRDGDVLLIGGGPHDSALMSFPLIPGDPNCVENATLRVTLREATPAELAVYPSALIDFYRIEDNSPSPIEPVIFIEGPPLAGTDGTPGELSWDLTGLYRTWATGAPLGEREGHPVGTPFTILIKPTVAQEAGRWIVLGSSEAEDGPVLSWVGAEGCGQ